MLRADLKSAIKKCYPRKSKQSTENSPRPNELSSLIFALETSHGKIPRAAKILASKTQTYTTKGSEANLVVTLRIVKEVVSMCGDHLDLFASSVLDIIGRTLMFAQGSDALLIDEGAQIFEAFNEAHTGVLFAGNAEYASQFSGLVEEFGSLTREKHPRLVRLSAADALRSLTNSPALAMRIAQQALSDTVVTSLYTCIPQSLDIFSKFNEEMSEHERRIRATGPGTASTSSSSMQFANNRRDPESLAMKALDGIRASLVTNSSDQLVRVFISLLKITTADTSKTQEWRRAFVEAAAQWSELQLRFAVVKTLVSELTQRKAVDLDRQIMLSDLLGALLESDVSKVGLSVVDVLRQLLDLQHRLLPRDVPSVPRLVDSLRANIGSLAELRTYPGQISDMIAETLARYATENAPVRQNPQIIANDLNDVRTILANADGTQGRSLPLALWGSTHWMLASSDRDVLLIFVQVFTQFMILRDTPPDESETATASTSRQGAMLTRQIIQVLGDDVKDPANFIAVYYCLVALVQHLGCHCHVVLPYVLQIQLLVPREGSAWRRIGLISIRHALLLAILRTTKRDDAAKCVASAIDARVKAGRWLSGIEFPVSESIDSVLGSTSIPDIPDSEAGAMDTDISSLEDMGLSQTDDDEWARTHSAPLDDPASADDLVVFKGNRSRSAASVSVNGSSRRLPSTRSNATAESSAPRVADLLRRRPSHANFSTQTNGKSCTSSSRTPSRAASILDLVEHMRLDETSRGRLTI